MMKCFVSIILFVIFLNDSINAQIISFERDTVRSFYSGFNNDLNTANLTSSLYLRSKYKKVHFYIINNFNSSVTKFNENLSNDYNNLELKSVYNLYGKFYSGAGITSKIVTSNQQLDLNNGYSNFYFSAFDLIPSNRLNFNTKFGIKDEKQVNEYSTGFAGIVESAVQNINIYDFISSGKLYMSLDKFTERTNYNYELNTNVEKVFSNDARNNGVLRAFTVRTDFYTPATKSIIESYGIRNNIQSRHEDYFYLTDDLDYRFSNTLRFKINGSFYLKNIKNQYKYKPSTSGILTESVYDNNIKENLLRAGFEAEYRLNALSARVNVSYTERTEDHSPLNIDYLPAGLKTGIENIEKDKNNNSRTTTLYGEILFKISNTNTLRVQGASSLLKYDTNSELNFDDRDELLLNGMISHRFYNFKNFFIETFFEYNSSVLNYIFKEKSANNNNNRVYKLNSYSVFNPVNGFITKNFFQVLSNYTVYKYEDIISQVQSFSYRQLYLSDSTDINFSKNVIWGLFGELKLYEQGQFDDKKFSVKPLAYYDERTIGTTINYESKSFVRVFLGYRHYIRRFYNFEKTDKVLKRTQSTYGPFAGINLSIRKNSAINILGGLDRIESSDNSQVTVSENLVIKILWNI